ncbi:SDR family NAD(P)-dependent oxidoreductase [Lunatimonas lonarensis]|uniref:SDR family NAD(P)-dependent oxidoreductase n=1 Tax=Lunatimonas lonarensis TaxID=1232681 RepID=UPI0004BC6994|nr:SDR family NAD(P)-dependent oxidoreductase [Lunatimonas lonarensis]
MEHKKRILITGATSGVGKAAAMALAGSENELILIARNEKKGEAVKREILNLYPFTKVSLLLGDLSLMKDIRKVARQFQNKFESLDVLINCAGLVSSDRVETSEGIEQTLAVNYLSHYLLSNLLLPELKKSNQGRIINVASLIPPIAKVNFDDLNSEKNYNGIKAYLQSKAADVMFTYDLAEELKHTNMTVNAVHPGVVKTNLGVNTSKGFLYLFVKFSEKFLAITPEKSAKRIVYLATDPGLSKITGKYFKGGKKPVATNSFSNNPENRKKLLELTKLFIGQN